MPMLATPSWQHPLQSAGTKTSDTTTSLTFTTVYVARVGDFAVASLGMDPTTGAVTFGHTGTAVLGPWTTVVDSFNSTGTTTGVRLVVAYARVTTAGTVTALTATYPATVAKVLLGRFLQEADEFVGVSTIYNDPTGTAPFFDVAESLDGANLAVASYIVFEAADGASVTHAAAPTGWGTRQGSIGAGVAGSNAPVNSNIALGFAQYGAEWVKAGRYSFLSTTSLNVTALRCAVMFRAAHTPSAPTVTDAEASNRFGSDRIRVRTSVPAPSATVTGERSLDGGVTWQPLGAFTQNKGEYYVDEVNPAASLHYRLTATNGYGTASSVFQANWPLKPVERSHNFETPANGTVLTSASTGGTGVVAFDWTFDKTVASNLRAARGTQYARGQVQSRSHAFSPPDTRATALRWRLGVGTHTSLFLRGYFYLESWPTTTVPFAIKLLALSDFNDTASTSVSGSVDVRDQRFAMTDPTSTFTHAVTTAPLNSWFRLELNVVKAGTTTMRIFLDPHATTPTETISVASGTAELDMASFIDPRTTGDPYYLGCDEVAISAVDWLGPAPVYVPATPTVFDSCGILMG